MLLLGLVALGGCLELSDEPYLDEPLDVVTDDPNQWQGSIDTVHIGRWQDQRPIADPGGTIVSRRHQVVVLDGTASYAPTGESLRYRWQLLEKPQGSATNLRNAQSFRAFITPDLPGMYELALIVSTGELVSEQSNLTVIARNQAPHSVAEVELEPNKVGDWAILNARQTMDPDNDEMSYQWLIVERPQGSQTQLIRPNQVQTRFVADKAGQYTVELRVKDGFDAAVDTVSVYVVAAE